MVVPGPTNATAAQIHITHIHTVVPLGNGSQLSNRRGGPEATRAGLGINETLVGNGRTPPSRPTAPAAASDGDSRYRQINGRALDDGRRDINASSPQSATISSNSRHQEDMARKTALTVASLNMNGYGNLIRDHQDNKWGRMYRMMADLRIGILLLQETHLTEERKAGLHKMFAKRVKIFHSAHPAAPTQREGVAIVLNSRFVNTSEASCEVIVPGRAIQVSIACLGNARRNILCVYAPTSNGAAERKRFFEEVRAFYEARPDFPKPHLMGGDFNNVEDIIDRLPINEVPDQSVLALDELKISLGLMVADGWRVTYPTTREYSFHRGSGCEAVFSRLDRLYVSPGTFDCAREWRISEAGVKTDHSLISVQLTAENAPVMGPGRPIFPMRLLKDRCLTKRIKERGLEATRELDRLEALNSRTEAENPQIVLHKFKIDLMRIAREREREVIPKLLADIRECERALKSAKAAKDLTERGTVDTIATLTKQTRDLKQRRYKQQLQNSRATHRLYGDRPTKYWSKLHKVCAPREVIPAFELIGQVGVAGEKIYESDSARMAGMARTHHMNIQRDDPNMRPAETRENDTLEALASIESRVSEEQAAELGGIISYEDCVLSLRFAKNGTAPGLDGIQFEVWKALHARHIEDARFPSRPDFDIVRLLAAAFEDMRTYGVSIRTSLAQGWMAPIYKEKGERTQVANYRPITVLNTDYKLLSKALAVRLADVAPGLIHHA